MKFAIAIAFSLLSLSSFAGERVSDVVSRIEADRQVRCDYIKSSFAFCLGTPRELATCRYSQTYSCIGAENFTLKLKVKESYNARSNQRETVVTKIQYL